MTATHHVFGTVELLESVLLQLDFSSLSRCLRVCRHFRNTIEGSKALKTVLWWGHVPAANLSRIDKLIEKADQESYRDRLVLCDPLRQIVLNTLQKSLHPVIYSLVSASVELYFGSVVLSKGRERVSVELNRQFVDSYCIDTEAPSNWRAMRATNERVEVSDKTEIETFCTNCWRTETSGPMDGDSDLRSTLDAARKVAVKFRQRHTGCKNEDKVLWLFIWRHDSQE